MWYNSPGQTTRHLCGTVSRNLGMRERVNQLDELTPIEKMKVYASAVQQIQRLITQGTWAMGEKIPSERELARHLGVGRTSIREALRVLEVMGFIEIRPGEGTYVRSNAPTFLPDTMVQALRESTRSLEVYEAREMLETQASYLAAERADSDDIAALHEVLTEMETALDRGELGDREDREFHITIARITGNGLLERFQSIIFDLIGDSLTASLAIPDRGRSTLAEHRQVAERIERGDARGASEAMRHHLRSCEREVLSRLRSEAEARMAARTESVASRK